MFRTNRVVLVQKIKKVTKLYPDSYLMELSNEGLLETWLLLSRPVKQPRRPKETVELQECVGL